jgi:hypothetical protein
MGTSLSIPPLRRDIPEAHLHYFEEKSIMKTSGLPKWGERVPSKIRLFLDALRRFNEDHCFLPGIALKANFAASILWEVAILRNLL